MKRIIVFSPEPGPAELKLWRHMHGKGSRPLICQNCGLPTILCPFSGSHPEGM